VTQASPSDDELMRAFIDGDTTAMEALFNRHRRELFGWLVLHAENRSEAEDIYQETWLRVLENASAYTPDGNFRAWLWRIARNLAADRARKKKPALILDAPSGEDDEAPMLDSIPDETAVHALAGMEADERRARVRTAVGRLSAALRDVVLLRVNGELEFREIARTLDLPLGTVLARMHNAVAKLKKMLVKEGA
jgi:RNA polymerase sigma-70 factor (ECF subfamily)